MEPEVVVDFNYLGPGHLLSLPFWGKKEEAGRKTGKEFRGGHGCIRMGYDLLGLLLPENKIFHSREFA